MGKKEKRPLECFYLDERAMLEMSDFRPTSILQWRPRGGHADLGLEYSTEYREVGSFQG